MPAGELIRLLLEQAKVRVSRSTALQPLAWIIAVFLAAALIALGEHAPVWAVAILFALVVVFSVQFSRAFEYFMKKDPNALRSEHFNLRKLAIEKSVKGDDNAGFAEGQSGALRPPSKANPELPPTETKAEKNS